MTIYLVIITTVLVITQIIRLIQNAMQISNNRKIDEHNVFIMHIYEKLDIALDVYLSRKAKGGF